MPPSKSEASRRYPVGAEPVAGGVDFRVWAPDRRQITLVLEGEGAESTHDLIAEPGGYFAATVPAARVGSRYRLLLDGRDGPFPDPASRYQPDGPHGPSVVVDPSSFAWSDQDWRGVSLPGQVLYEFHVGTFTPEGSWTAAIDKLRFLRDLGVTLLEMMPINDFPGSFGWGYDGVDLFAPTRLYGEPDDLRRFVDAAHRLGLGVILDVVYNHFGPDGCYVAQFARDYFHRERGNEWGASLNFDGPNSVGVREFFVTNARYWIDEFHFDGLRLDATQSIHDSSPVHVVAELIAAARKAAGSRQIVVTTENERQDSRLIRPPETGGYGGDAMWNDDFHHSAMVAATGRRQAYYSDHSGMPQEFVSAAKYGTLFQGQVYGWQKARRGTPALDLDPGKFVTFTQNHDQVANTGRGRRLHLRAALGQDRALTALMLLMPATPMLFQGQEFHASSLFLFFADHGEELAKLVRSGRETFLAQFPSLADEEMVKWLPDPSDPETFRRCKLDWTECARNTEAVALHRDLLRLRRETVAACGQGRGAVDGAVLGPQAFVLRFFARDGADRLLVVNLGIDITAASFAEPLLAPPAEMAWAPAWSSEDPDYGGSGTPPVEATNGWHLPGHSAMLLRAMPVAEAPPLPALPTNPELDRPSGS